MALLVMELPDTEVMAMELLLMVEAMAPLPTEVMELLRTAEAMVAAMEVVWAMELLLTEDMVEVWAMGLDMAWLVGWEPV